MIYDENDLYRYLLVIQTISNDIRSNFFRSVDLRTFQRFLFSKVNFPNRTNKSGIF